jgi:UDP-N-acetylglucosamine--N-acetylmuramyl-(pentapeptide) pyrophosphoryl-undecaprenol N-acetylglucosamine transferase
MMPADEADSGTRWVVFAGGGTGGHLFPALAVVEALRRQPEPIDVSFFCTRRPIDRELLGEAGVEALPLSVRPLSMRPWHWPRFWWRWRESVALCKRVFYRRRPAAVVGAGGYASGPPVHAALALGIPTFVLNPDAVPGRANRYLGSRSGLSGIFAQWEVTRRCFPAGSPVEVTGCPVRPAFRAARRANLAGVLASFGLEPGRRTLLVTGASQGARTINEALALLAGRLDWTGWQVLHLAGPADVGRVSQAFARLGRQSARPTLKACVLPFTNRMPEAMAAADLVVSRAGASTLAEIQAVGKPSILLPYPYHRDQHQRHNAMVLVEAGAAVWLEDARDGSQNADRLGPVLGQLMKDDARREAMARAVRTLDRPDAAETIAGRLLERAWAGPACDFCAGRPVKTLFRRTA